MNLQLMYDLYVQEMSKNGSEKFASVSYYRKIFNEDFKIKFHQPKKDQCDECTAYKNLNDQQKRENEAVFQRHIDNKNGARKEMNNDKELAKTDKTVCVANVDLQKVLSLPKAEISCLYYKRKVSVYNFTIFNMANHDGFCYVWDETTAKRGANEIASCIFSFLKDMSAKGYKKFIFWSNNCGGQNRNQYLFSMYIRAAKLLKIEITHKYENH